VSDGVRYPNLRREKTAEAFAAHLAALGLDLGFDEIVEPAPDGPLAQPATAAGFTIGNRLSILPMEGWDGTTDGRPSDLTRRRWRRFGASGAKLIWGGEAVAVEPSGRANPNQLVIEERLVANLAELRRELVEEHERTFGRTDDLLVGLQLTHSGRYSRPDAGTGMQPRVAYRHPFLDPRVGITDDAAVLTDDELDRLVARFVAAAAEAKDAGFAFVDVKACHGYLGHELLSAVDRPGPYGGSLEGRTHFLRSIVGGIRATVPDLAVAVRFSAFDWAPFRGGAGIVGSPEVDGREPYPHAFGGDGTGLGIDLTEPKRFLDLLAQMDIELVCTTAGSPYYNPHIQRPAAFPPSDGYLPPEDPLAGVARQIAVTAQLKAHRPDLFLVGSGYSYLQEWFGPVGQHAVRTGAVDAVGLGRMALSHPHLAADLLAGRTPDPTLLCRTLSDCTTAPRHGLVSGCYPLDDFYGELPERAQLALIKKEQRQAKVQAR
jgi:NADPH2 dehydrogenase